MLVIVYYLGTDTTFDSDHHPEKLSARVLAPRSVQIALFKGLVHDSILLPKSLDKGMTSIWFHL